MADKPLAEIEDLLHEDRTFPPPPGFKAHAIARDESIYAEAERDPEAFWARFADELEWSRRWDCILDWNPPHAKWFVGGTLNVSVNCLDRHVRGARRNKAAIIWEGEPGDRRAHLLRSLPRGLNLRERSQSIRYQERRPRRDPPAAHPRAGDRHARLRPRCGSQRGSAVSARARDRINDQGARLLITADAYRRDRPFSETIGDERRPAPSIEHTIVVQRGAIGSARRCDPCT